MIVRIRFCAGNHASVKWHKTSTVCVPSSRHVIFDRTAQ